MGRQRNVEECLHLLLRDLERYQKQGVTALKSIRDVIRKQITMLTLSYYNDEDGAGVKKLEELAPNVQTWDPASRCLSAHFERHVCDWHWLECPRPGLFRPFGWQARCRPSGRGQWFPDQRHGSSQQCAGGKAQRSSSTMRLARKPRLRFTEQILRPDQFKGRFPDLGEGAQVHCSWRYGQDDRHQLARSCEDSGRYYGAVASPRHPA